MGAFQRLFKGSLRAPEVGGDAIKEVFQNNFGDQEPIIYEYGEVPVVAYSADDPLPHFFYSTFGISRVNSSTPVAGMQTELTIRIPRDEALPPSWPAKLLNRVAQYLSRTDNPVEPGHHMDFDLPLTDDSTLTSLIFVTDPIMGVIDTKTGFVRFTYAIGMTPTDLNDALIWDARKFAGVFGEFFPLGLTDPDRAPLRDIDKARSILDDVIGRQGSSLSAVMANYLDFTDDDPLRLDLTTTSAEHLLRAVRYRIKFDRNFAFVSRKKWVEMVPGEFEAEFEKDHLRLGIPDQLANEILATFGTRPGAYAMTTAPLTIHVIDPTR
ncbi:suppressor of fused domain protein [Corynebacterium breve]|uniref:Suppressor of fused domain protein n=1 Tax=Corynebacterium breve TaxID=3049799 RepID=A0ABY8VHE4_9CORY|nr:suppressor of fused domain protein [Corynebacterium breve]WIM68492.1 suppressor of fused domain protein [Corynebacterium breve]